MISLVSSVTLASRSRATAKPRIACHNLLIAFKDSPG
jgi:hypothetical protein